MGLEGLTGWHGRKHFFVDAIANFDTAERGDPHWLAIQFMKTMKVDRVAAALLLPTFKDAQPEWLAAFTMPTLVLCGTEDQDNGSAPNLVAALARRDARRSARARTCRASPSPSSARRWRRFLAPA